MRHLLALPLLCGFAFAQSPCTPAWIAEGALPVPPSGDFQAAVLWDRDGAGPLPEVLVVAGLFSIPRLGIQNVAVFDFTTQQWQALGTPPNAIVRALAVLPNGDLVAGGWFSQSGSVATNGLARWNGSQWTSFGTGVSGGTWPPHAQVHSLLVTSQGDLYVAGIFDNVDGVPANNIARWDGSQWHALGAGTADGWAMAEHPSGDVYVHAGSFSGSVQRWDGSAWSTVFALSTFAGGDLVILANGDVLATGVCATSTGPTNNIVRWDGVATTPLAPGTNWLVSDLTVLPNGDVVAAGGFIAPGTNCQRWDGSVWHPLAAGTGSTVNDLLTMPDGRVLAVGDDGSVSAHVPSLQLFDNGQWVPVGGGLNNVARCLVTLPGRGVAVGGDFLYHGAGYRRYAALLDGGGSSPLALPFTGNVYAPVTAMAAMPNGDLLLNGMLASGVPALARWNGTAVSLFSAGLPSSQVRALAVAPNGRVFAGLAQNSSGSHLVTWNGSSWTDLGGPAARANNSVEALLVHSTGAVVAGGAFTAFNIPAPYLAQWNGSAWQALPGLDGPVHSLLELDGGDLLVGGEFMHAGNQMVGGIARWNGTSWSAVGSGFANTAGTTRVAALLQLPNGTLVAGGSFDRAGATNTANLAWWDGSSWRAFGAGVEGAVHALACDDDGCIVVAGDFWYADGAPSAHLARFATPCPASTEVIASGCVGPDLRVLRAPWLGGSYRTVCDLGGPGAIGVELFGFAAAAVPITNLFSNASPGCQLLTTGELATIVSASTGALVTDVRLPVDYILVGQQLHHQVLRVQFAPSGVVTGLVPSSAIRFQVGALR